MAKTSCVLGAGVTGLAVGMVSGLPVYEAAAVPGGICSSYYMRPGGGAQLHQAPSDGNAYRFELGGGHWIFGGDPLVVRLINSLSPLKSYVRRSSVYLPDRQLFVPFPIQNHLFKLGPDLAARALNEMVKGMSSGMTATTMEEWQRLSFGQTLCEIFFDPFHELYTAGLWKQIVPQDGYKSPVNLALTIQGAFREVPPVGYNVTFVYPVDGLDSLVRKMAARSDVRVGKRVIAIDVRQHLIRFDDGSEVAYERLLSTLPLNRMMELTGLTVDQPPDPCTAVLVINIGARKGERCPGDHWVYVPRSKGRFHRVGFYSNVDESFLPVSVQGAGSHVSIYVERAYRDGQRPRSQEMEAVVNDTVGELRDWGWIEDVEVADPTWIDVAYTWSWAGSQWKRQALKILEDHGIDQVGRFARWAFQGIGDSIRDGLMAGAAISVAGGRAQSS